MPIRWRLTFWFSMVVLAILVITNIVLYSHLERYLINEADNNLEIYTSRVHGTLLPALIDQPLDYVVIHSQLPAINEFSSPGVYLELLDKSGAVVVKSDNLGKQELPVATALIYSGFSGNAAIGTVAAGDGARVRILASPLYLQNQTLILEVAQSMKLIDTTMNRLRLALLGSVLLALVLVVASGAFTVRRTLLPVQRIARIARDIESSGDLSRRVGHSGPADEIGQLATTFDHMIEHLDNVFKSQKKFIADASHELRSPLTVIRGNLDLAKRNPSKDNQAESLRAIEAETSRMSKIVNDLLLLAEVQSGQALRHEQVQLQDVVMEEFRRARVLAAKRHIAFGKVEDISIVGDGYRLRQLLGNLLDNALKYTPDGGAITLSVFREGDWARLEVTDTGIGIAPEHLPYLFDRFYRVDKARSKSMGGTGLGLSIVKGIAEQHGGKVTVTSEPGKGSTFAVWLKPQVSTLKS